MMWHFEIERLEHAQRLIKILSFLCGGLLLSTLCLSIAVVLNDQKWVLIPQYGIDHRVTIRRSGWTHQYLVDWADAVATQALTLSPETVDRRHGEILRLGSVASPELRTYLRIEAQKIKRDHMSTVFYSKSFDINNDKQVIRVRGTLLVYLGRDKNPLALEKSYVLSYAWVDPFNSSAGGEARCLKGARSAFCFYG